MGHDVLLNLRVPIDYHGVSPMPHEMVVMRVVCIAIDGVLF
jgi:hypothetical protein